MTDQDRYNVALHGIQSGIAMLMNYDEDLTSPKHLRVGVNSGLVSVAALVNLLVKKGVITIEEYWKSLADEAEKERENLKAEIQEVIFQRTGKSPNIILG